MTWAVVWNPTLRAHLTHDPRRSIGRHVTVTYTHRTIAGALDAVADELNDRPRKRFAFATPTEQI